MILCSGCFDGLHAGHVAYLRGAAALTEPRESLWVAVACDDYIRLHKGREPHWPAESRASVLKALMFVTDTVSHGPDGAAHIIRWLRPRMFVKGDDWRLMGLPEDVIAACVEVGCTMAFIDSGSHKHSADALSPHQ